MTVAARAFLRQAFGSSVVRLFGSSGARGSTEPPNGRKVECFSVNESLTIFHQGNTV
jgi:hypothetical protein